MDPLGNRLCVFVDTREKVPYEFPGHDVRYTKLAYGDYSAHGLKNIFEVERKSVPDLVCTMVVRSRWQRWLKKCEGWKRQAEQHSSYRMVVVEGHFNDLFKLPQNIYNNIGVAGINLAVHRLQLVALTGVQVWFMGDRVNAARMVLGLLGRELEARDAGRTVEERLYPQELKLALPG
jgi:ERCC4-type nuclease